MLNCWQYASSQKIEIGSMEPEKKKGGASVALRWLTAIILMPIVLLFVWFGGWAAFVAITAVVVLGLYELSTMLRHAGYRPLLWVSLGLALLFLVAAMFPLHQLLILEIGIAVLLMLSFCCFYFRKNLDGALVDWALTLASALYLGWPMSFFLLLRGMQPGRVIPLMVPAGTWWLLVTLLGVWGFDAAAFFAGRYFGRHKLAPTISPAKTWEGVLGGLILSVIASLLCTVVPLGVPWYVAILLGICIGVFATLGDLAESLLKRQTRVKDSGQIMPGHGGMLDRIDSLLFAIMVVFIFAQFFVK
ncbi:phosphatidate cytidylyltransferase [Ktedonobacteria bacterium brp13]|nr:phosphatidate cytidylyltransferase [Ktedonobacteria bacterium brp13]